MKRFIAILISLLLAIPASAEITATVSPGYTFSEGERVTATKLNLLSLPTITITGTLGGTNVALGAGTVTGTMLADGVAGTNLTYAATSPRSLVVVDNGITSYQIATSVAGNGLGGGGGFALSNKVDSVLIITTNDVVTLSSNIPPSNLLVTSGSLVGGVSSHGANVTLGTGLALLSGTLTLTNFVSAEYSLSSGQIANTNHNLGTTPTLSRWVLVCKTNDAGYVPGDEVSIDAFYDDTTVWRQCFAGGCNATNVYISMGGTPSVRNKSSGSSDSITQIRWRAKNTARP